MPRHDARRVLLPALSLALTLAAPVMGGEAGLPPPIVPHGFGVNIHFTDPGPGEMARFAEAGYRFVRMDFAWGGVERQRGVYDFSAYDRLIDHLEKVKARPILILDYGNRLYDGGMAPSTEAGRAAFAKFAAAGAARFRGKGVLWEIWNEPNIGFWKPKPNADDYAKLAVATARAVSAADPDAVILAPGTSEFPWSFFEATFQRGLLEHVDAVSVHPYRGQAPESAVADYGRLRALIARFAPPAKRRMPIVSSEWGYSTRIGGNISEARQAQYLTRMWLVNMASGVNLSIFYDWKDDGPDPRENEHRFGTVKQNLEPKPSFLAAKALIAALDGYTYRHRLAGKDEHDWRLLFQKGDSDAIAVAAWSAAAGASDTAATPKVRKVASSDPDFAGLRGLAAVHFAAGPLAESASQPAELEVSTASGRVAIALGVSSATRPEITPAAPRRVAVPSAALRPEHRLLPIGLLRDGKPLPAVAPLEIWRVDPISITAAPRGNALEAAITSPAPPSLSGRLTVEAGPTETASVPVTLRKHGPPVTTVSLPRPAGLHRLLFEAEGGTIVALLGPRRYEAMAGFPTLAGTATGYTAVKFVENAPVSPVAVAGVAGAPGDPGAVALDVRYTFEAGWRYLSVNPPGPAPIPAGARALTLWIDPVSGQPDDALRCRFRDATGQTFQPDLGRLGAPGWRALSIPLDGKGPGGHWGGADDGVIHPPLAWEALILIDSAHRDAHDGAVRLASPFYVFEK